jgi:hypothetical protein
VTWIDQSSNEDGFRIERSSDGGRTWIVASPASANAYELVDGDRISEQEVCYRVIAFNGSGESPPSNTLCTTPPAGPTDLTWTEGVLSWSDNSVVEDGYEIWMMDAGGVAYEGLLIRLPASSTSLSVGGCGPIWCWGFAVVATKNGGYSDWAQVVTRSQ